MEKYIVLNLSVTFVHKMTNTSLTYKPIEYMYMYYITYNLSVHVVLYRQYVSVCEKQAVDSLAAMNSCGIED